MILRSLSEPLFAVAKKPYSCTMMLLPTQSCLDSCTDIFFAHSSLIGSDSIEVTFRNGPFGMVVHASPRLVNQVGWFEVQQKHSAMALYLPNQGLRLRKDRLRAELKRWLSRISLILR